MLSKCLYCSLHLENKTYDCQKSTVLQPWFQISCHIKRTYCFTLSTSLTFVYIYSYFIFDANDTFKTSFLKLQKHLFVTFHRNKFTDSSWWYHERWIEGQPRLEWGSSLTHDCVKGYYYRLSFASNCILLLIYILNTVPTCLEWGL